MSHNRVFLATTLSSSSFFACVRVVVRKSIRKTQMSHLAALEGVLQDLYSSSSRSTLVAAEQHTGAAVDAPAQQPAAAEAQQPAAAEAQQAAADSAPPEAQERAAADKQTAAVVDERVVAIAQRVSRASECC